MAYLNFTDQLTEAKRRSRLQGRGVTQQEAAGISEGVAASAGDRAMQAEQLAQNKEQYEKTLAQREKEWGASNELQQKTFAEQVKQNADQYALAKKTFDAQVSQYEASSATQRDQFGQQMAYQISQSRDAMTRYEKDYGIVKNKYASELLAAGQPLPADIFAPPGWDAAAYLRNNPDVDAFRTDKGERMDPLTHWYKYPGRTW